MYYVCRWVVGEMPELSYCDGANSYECVSGNYAAVKGYVGGSDGVDECSSAMRAYPSEASDAS